MGLDRGRLFIREDGVTRTVRAGIAIELADEVALDRNTIVIADVVNVEKPVRTSGHSLTIICRSLRFSDTGLIDLSGAAATVTFLPGRAERKQGHENDVDGPDGDNGGPGEPAGHLTLHCHEAIGTLRILAQGGRGGRPQDGGYGRQGLTGPSGPDSKARSSIRIDQTIGGTGGKGGSAGLPGWRGSGGIGGAVELYSVLALQLASNPDVSGGEPGDAGNPGQPGEGGEGGEGGQYWTEECHEIIGGGHGLGDRAPFFSATTHSVISRLALTDTSLASTSESNADLDGLLKLSAAQYAQPLGQFCRDVYKGRGPKGKPGEEGDSRAEDLAKRQAAPARSDGSISRAIVVIDRLSLLFDPMSLSLISLQLEEQYRSAGSASLPSSYIEALNFYLSLSTALGTDQMTDFSSRVYSMAQKINLGLDFFGYRLNQAPLLSFETYETMVNTALSVADIVEHTFNAYWDAEEAVKGITAALRTGQSAAQQSVAGITGELDRTLKATGTALEDVDKLNTNILVLYRTLLTKRHELDAAIAAKTPGCDLVGSLIAVSTIVAGIATGGTALIGAAAAGAKLYKDVSADKIQDPTDKDGKRTLAGLWDKRYVVRDELKEIGDKAKAVGENVSAIRDAITDLRAQGKPTDVPQFRMAREAFDEVAKSYADLPEATAYRDIGYAYLNAVETRSQRIMDYNSYLVMAIDLRTRRRSAERFSDAAATALTGASDPAAPLIVTSLAELYRDTLSSIGQMIHAERKALAYTLADPAPAPQSQLSLGHLLGSHMQIVGKAKAAKEDFAPKIKLNEDILKIDLRDFVSDATWETFKRTHVLQFVISHDHPKYRPTFSSLPLLRMTGVQLHFDHFVLAQGQTQLPWNLTHMGVEKLYRMNGQVVEFSHKSTTVPGTSPVPGNASLLDPDFSQQGMYTGVSPFAGWLLQISDSDELGANIQNTESVWMSLRGFIMPLE